MRGSRAGLPASSLIPALAAVANTITEQRELSFGRGIDALFSAYNFTDLSQPVVFNLGDEKYAQTLVKWSERCDQLGWSQHFIIAFDATTQRTAMNHGLPFLTSSGDYPYTRSNVFLKDYEMPDDISATKWVVPQLLLLRGFERVVDTEADIYFFADPRPHMLSVASQLDWAAQSASSQQGTPNIFGMRHDYPCTNAKNVRFDGTLNIGFMQFTGNSTTLFLGELLRQWDAYAQTDVDPNERTVDEVFFNDFLQNWPIGPEADQITVAALPTEFATCPSEIDAETVVGHMTWISEMDTKAALIDAAYELGQDGAAGFLEARDSLLPQGDGVCRATDC